MRAAGVHVWRLGTLEFMESELQALQHIGMELLAIEHPTYHRPEACKWMYGRYMPAVKSLPPSAQFLSDTQLLPLTCLFQSTGLLPLSRSYLTSRQQQGCGNDGIKVWKMLKKNIWRQRQVLDKAASHGHASKLWRACKRWRQR